MIPPGCGLSASPRASVPTRCARRGEAGLTDLGENYAAELVAKAAADDGDDGVVWHFLGAVQRNKVAQLAPIVGVWQSVAREAEGARIARFAPGARVLVQVDTTGLPGRNGCAPSAGGRRWSRAWPTSGSMCGVS